MQIELFEEGVGVEEVDAGGGGELGAERGDAGAEESVEGGGEVVDHAVPGLAVVGGGPVDGAGIKGRVETGQVQRNCGEEEKVLHAVLFV